MSIEAMKQALKAISQFIEKELTVGQRYTNAGQRLLEEIEALRTAIQQAEAKQPVTGELEPYDAGLLGDFGGGNVEWWQDYVRAELGRAHDFYQSQSLALPPAQATQPAEVTEVSLKRPECFDFAMDFLGDPEAPKVIEYVESLERALLALRPAQVPMNQDEVSAAIKSANISSSTTFWSIFEAGIRAAEARQGITASQQPKEPS